MTAGKLMEALEALVDAESLHSVVECLADMCEEKAEHIRHDWQDHDTARVWSKASKCLLGLCEYDSIKNI